MVNKQIFHLAYHMKQQVSDVWNWPTKRRIMMLGMLEEQFKFEQEALDK
jgi:hypothetical protein